MQKTSDHPPPIPANPPSWHLPPAYPTAWWLSLIACWASHPQRNWIRLGRQRRPPYPKKQYRRAEYIRVLQFFVTIYSRCGEGFSMSFEHRDQSRLLDPGPSNSTTTAYGSISISQDETRTTPRKMAAFIPTKATTRLASLSLFCGLGSFLWG